MSAVITSRVVNASKAITSRSGVERATKARETLATAQAILRATGTSDGHDAADLMQPTIDTLSRQIVAFYQNAGSRR